MVVRGWKLIAGVFTVMVIGLLDRFVSGVMAWPTDVTMEPIVTPYNEDAAESELTDAIYEYPAVEQAPPPVSMPIGNRFVATEPQRYGRFTPIDDNWWMGTPAVMLLTQPPVTF